jgi:hypothetical protein
MYGKRNCNDRMIRNVSPNDRAADGEHPAAAGEFLLHSGPKVTLVGAILAWIHTRKFISKPVTA